MYPPLFLIVSGVIPLITYIYSQWGWGGAAAPVSNARLAPESVVRARVPLVRGAA